MNKQESTPRKKKGIKYFVVTGVSFSLMLSVLLSPMLLIAGGAYLGGLYFDRKESKIAADGIKTTATVFDATYDHLGSLLQGTADNKTNKSSSQRNNSAECTIFYRFDTQDGQTIEGSVNREYYSLEHAKSEIGSEIDIVYSAADPNVYETGVGHTNTQAEAMYWIAIAFVVIWGLCAMAGAFYPIVEEFKSKSRKKQKQKRIKKQKEKRLA